MSKILIIIPAYNEEKNISYVIQDIRCNCSDVDILVVNDCSTDHTIEVLCKYEVKYLDLPVNLGIGGAVQTGFKYAAENDYDIAIQFDGDGQHNAKYIHTLISAVEKENAEIAVGSRFINKTGFQSTEMRRIGIVILSKVIELLCGLKTKDVTSGMRAFNRRMISYFSKHYAQDYPEPEALLTAGLMGAIIIEVPVEMNERISGKSSISALSSVYYMIKVTLALIFQRIIIKRIADHDN